MRLKHFNLFDYITSILGLICGFGLVKLAHVEYISEHYISMCLFIICLFGLSWLVTGWIKEDRVKEVKF